MTLESVFALMAAVSVFALKPGPGILTAMSYSLSHGFSGLLSFLVGFNVGLGIYLAIVFIGLMGINHFDIDFVFLAILAKSLAAVYLIAIGLKEFQRRNEDPEETLKVEKTKKTFEIVGSAAMLTISNPMVIVFYASIIPVFIAPEVLKLDIAMALSFILMFIDSLGMIIYCVPLILFRKTLPAVFMNNIRTVSAVLIIIIGLYIGYTAIGAVDVLSVF